MAWGTPTVSVSERKTDTGYLYDWTSDSRSMSDYTVNTANVGNADGEFTTWSAQSGSLGTYADPSPQTVSVNVTVNVVRNVYYIRDEIVATDVNLATAQSYEPTSAGNNTAYYTYTKTGLQSGGAVYTVYRHSIVSSGQYPTSVPVSVSFTVPAWDGDEPPSYGSDPIGSGVWGIPTISMSGGQYASSDGAMMQNVTVGGCPVASYDLNYNSVVRNGIGTFRTWSQTDISRALSYGGGEFPKTVDYQITLPVTEVTPQISTYSYTQDTEYSTVPSHTDTVWYTCAGLSNGKYRVTRHTIGTGRTVQTTYTLTFSVTWESTERFEWDTDIYAGGAMQTVGGVPAPVTAVEWNRLVDAVNRKRRTAIQHVVSGEPMTNAVQVVAAALGVSVPNRVTAAFFLDLRDTVNT